MGGTKYIFDKYGERIYYNDNEPSSKKVPRRAAALKVTKGNQPGRCAVNAKTGRCGLKGTENPELCTKNPKTNRCIKIRQCSVNSKSGRCSLKGTKNPEYCDFDPETQRCHKNSLGKDNMVQKGRPTLKEVPSVIVYSSNKQSSKKVPISHQRLSGVNAKSPQSTFCGLTQKEFRELLEFIEGKKLSDEAMYKRFEGMIRENVNWVCVEAAKLLPGNCLYERELVVLRLKKVEPELSRIIFEVGEVNGKNVREYILYLKDTSIKQQLINNSECISKGFVGGKELIGILMKPKLCDMDWETFRTSKSHVLRALHVTNYLRRYYSREKHKNDYNWVCSAMLEFLPNVCLLKEGWKPTKLLGAGVYGVTFEVRHPSGKLAAFKVIIKEKNAYFSPEQEIRMQNEFSDENLAPEVYCYSSTTIDSQQVFGILMSKIDMTLNDFMMKPMDRSQRLILIRSVFFFLNRMRESNLTHGDMHTQNMAVIKNPNDPMKLHLKLIDFGQSSAEVAHTRLDASQFLRGLSYDCEVNKMKKLPYDCEKRFNWFKMAINLYLQHIGEQPVEGTNQEFNRLHEKYVDKYFD
jgi:hypothetical protein